MRRSQGAAAVAVLMLAACARDLELPADRGVPRLTGILPASAYGGEWLRITGSAFDPDPAANQVRFGSGATVAASAIDGGALLVRVAPAAGQGAITVSNGRGASAPFSGFTFLGRGELERGQVVASRTLLHAPTGVVAAGSTYYLQSQLWGGLVNLVDSAFKGDGAQGAIAIDGGSALAWIDRTDPIAPRIVRYDLATKLTTSVPAPTTAYVYLAAVAGATPALAVAATDAVGGTSATMELRRASDLASLAAPRNLAAEDIDALADAGGGRVVLVARQSVGGPTGLLVAFPGGSPADSWIAPPGAEPLAGFQAQQPLAVGTRTDGHRIAVAVAMGGDLLTADLGLVAATGPFLFAAAPIALHFTVGRPSGLAADGKFVAASKRTEGLVLGVDLDTGLLAWSVPDASPGAATGAGGFFEIAGEASNDALDVAAATGIARARWDFSLFPGRLEDVSGSWIAGPGAAAWCGPPGCAKPELRIATTYPTGVLALPVGSATGTRGATVASTGGVAVVGGTQWTWSDPSVAPGWVTAEDGVAAPSTTAFTDAVLRVLPDAAGAWVVRTDGVSRVEGGVSVGTGAFPSAAAAAREPVLLPGGALAVAWAGATLDWSVATFTRASVVAGTAAAPLALPAEADALFVSDGEAWVVASGQPSVGPYVDRAIRIAGVPAVSQETVELTAAVFGAVAVSPNGRMLVRQTATGLQLRRADPRADFPILSEFPVDGSVAGIAFDATGETAWVVTRSPEKVLTLQ